MIKSMLKGSLLILLTSLSTLIAWGQNSKTATLRTKIVQDLTTNNSRQITAEKLRSVFITSANAIDSVSRDINTIFSSISVANSIGEYDASTGVAKVTATGATSTPGVVPAFSDGKYFDVVKAGISAVTGTAVNMAEGGKIIVRGTAWGYIPPSDLGLKKALALEQRFPFKNLANPSEFVDGYFVDGLSGATVAAAAYGHTGYIPVTAGMAYSGKGQATANGMRHVAFYNANKVIVSDGFTVNTTTFTVPAGVYYVIATYYAEDRPTFQFEQSATPTGFLAYAVSNLKYTIVSPSSIEVDAANRFTTDAEKITWNGKLNQNSIAYDVTRGKNLFKVSNVETTTLNVINTGSGIFSTIPNWIRTGAIPCKPSTNYIISGLASRNSKAIRFETEGGAFISFLPPPSVITGTTLAFTTPATAGKMYINLQRDGETVNLLGIQIEEGTVPTGYELYNEISKVRSIAGNLVPIIKVNGKAGDANSELSITKADLGISAVDNTADIAKPISTLQQAVFDQKLDKTSVVAVITGKSKNLANPAEFTDNFFIDGSSGFISALAGYGYTGYIPVNAGLPYTGKGSATNNGMRHVAFYNAAKTFVSGGFTAPTTTFTIPAGVAFVRVTYYAADKATFEFEQSATDAPSVPYDPGIQTLVSVAGALIPSGTPTQMKKTINLQDCERIFLAGDSYSVGYNALPGKSYLSALSMFSDWNFDNYSKSGDATDMILARLIGNTPQYKGIAPKQLKGGGYAVIISFTNDVNTSVINSTAQLDNYLNNVRLLAEGLKGLGYKPIVATEYHASNGSNGTGLLQSALSQLCNENGYIFMDVYEKTRYLKGASNFPYFWEGSHPNLRTNAIFWTNMKPYIDALPRPKWSIKIYRKRDSTNVSAVSDLMYVSNLDRAKKFKEILVTGQALNAASYSKYDDQSNWTSTGNVVNVGEYYDLMNGNSIAMGDYSLMECVVNGTPDKIAKLDIYVGPADSVYVKNHITQTWAPLTITSGLVSLTDPYSQVNFDKVSLLIYKSGGWNMSAPKIDFYGQEGKTYYQKSIPKEFRSSELITTRTFNAGTTGWTVTGTVTPFVPEDSGSMPTGISQVAPISSGNYVSQTVNFPSATYKRRVQLKVIARRNPARYISTNVFPAASPITLDSYDFANVKVAIAKSSNLITFKEVIGLHWTEAVFEFDVAAGDTSFIVSIQKDDQNFELADLSVKIE